MFCANCQRLLPQGQTVCSFCEGEIRALPAITWKESSYPAPPAGQGYFECPACHKHFDECLQIYVPPGAPVDKQTLLSDACPHCKTMLDWAPIPATTPVQHVLDGWMRNLQFLLTITYLFIGHQALFSTQANGKTKALILAIMLLPQLAVAFVPILDKRKSLLLGHYQLKQKRMRVAYSITLVLLTIAALICTVILLVRAAPSPLVTAIFYGLLGINVVASSWLVTLNLRQRYLAKLRRQQSPLPAASTH